MDVFIRQALCTPRRTRDVTREHIHVAPVVDTSSQPFDCLEPQFLQALLVVKDECAAHESTRRLLEFHKAKSDSANIADIPISQLS